MAYPSAGSVTDSTKDAAAIKQLLEDWLAQDKDEQSKLQNLIDLLVSKGTITQSEADNL